jgi:predicted hydrocarbon binding protein
MNQMQALTNVSRPELGNTIPVSVFRVFRQFSAHYGEDILGEKGVRSVFTYAGRELGMDIGQQLYTEDLSEYLTRVKKYVFDSSIGILTLAEDLSTDDKMVLQLGECVTCAGMPNIGQKICFFEVGLVAGIVETFTKKEVFAYETKCNANGDDCCEVTVELDPVKTYFS